MPIDIIDTLARKNGANFPLVKAEDSLGAFVTVADTTARDAIPTGCLRIGQIVRLGTTANFYEWDGAAWDLFAGFGSSGHTIKDEGVAVTPRTSLNFVGVNVAVTDDGSNTIVTVGQVNLTSGVTGVLPVANGGTGLSAAGTNGQVLTIVSGSPAWATPGGGSLTAPANPADDGKVAIASAGNFTYSLLANANVSASAAIALSKLADGTACSVTGRSANSSGAHADIAAASDGQVLRRSGGVLGFGTIETAGIGDTQVTLAKLANATSLSVLGRSANSAGPYADITATNDGEVLRRSGTTVGFGTIVAAGLATDSVTTAKILNANVTTAKIADGNVTTAKIADGNVTDAKLASTFIKQLQDVSGTAAPAQAIVQHKGAAILRDPANGRNIIDYDRADIREYGGNVGGRRVTTATGTAGNAAVTLASAQNYVDGNWLMLSGLGPAHGMATPGAPTLAVQGTTGSSTVSVKVVALTSTGGYTAASTATQVTTANATLSTTNFVEVWFADVPSAYRYLVYVQFGGSGNWTYFGGVIAHPQYDAVGRVEAMTFRITSSTPPTAPDWLPSTAPSTGRANGLRTKILTGGGTTSITVSPVPITSGTAVHAEACNLIPLEDAILSDPDGYSTEVRIPRGTLYVTGPLQIRSPTRLSGANGAGSGQGGSIIQFRHGCGVATYNTKGADQWQPGTLYRLGDRVVSQLRTGVTGCWTLTAVSGGGTWAVSGTTEPSWVYSGTTTDNGHTWTFGQLTYSAAGCIFERVAFISESSTVQSTIPSNRVVVEDDLRTGAQFLSGNGQAPQAWVANTAVALGVYWVPTDANVTGKIYEATVAGTTHATTEPTWPRVHGATVVDNGVTWTCRDVLRHQGAGVLLNTVTDAWRIQVRGFCGTGVVADGSSYSSAGAVSGSAWNKGDVRNNSGHAIAIYGADANGCEFRSFVVGTKGLGGSCIVQDNALYGNKFAGFIHDGGARYQNKCWTSSVQRLSVLENCYTEGVAGSDTDWNLPGQVNAGHHAQGFRAGSTALLNGVQSAAGFNTSLDSARLEYDAGGGGMSRQLISGFERKLWGSGTVAAATLLQEQHESQLATSGRSRVTVRGTTAVRETAHFDARGAGEIMKADFRVGSTFATESRFASITATPTVGVFNVGDHLTWCLDNRRLFIKPARAGGLGATARANSTAYVVGNVISASSKHFVCVAAGTSAASVPGGYASATIGVYVTDGTAIFQMWTTAQDPNLTAVPNLWADPVAVADADTTLQYVNVNDGQSCRDMPAATANRVMTLSTTGMIAGDCFHLRQLNNVAFTITINTVDGGSVVMPASTRCWTVIRMTRAGTFTQHSAGVLL